MEKWNKVDVLNEMSDEKWVFFVRTNRLFLWTDVNPYLINNYSGSMLNDTDTDVLLHTFNFSSESEFVKFKLTWY